LRSSKAIQWMSSWDSEGCVSLTLATM
jgi:hypothetical protein